jgi:hypothetical protein
VGCARLNLIVDAEQLQDRQWITVKDGNLVAADIFRRHYTYRVTRAQISLFWQRNRNYNLIAGPGEKTILITPCGRALFVWRKFRPMNDQSGVNCAVFRNEGAGLSSDLIRTADEIAWERWPGERLYTYVDPKSTRHKRDPGRCFLKAGWKHCGWTPRGLRILECLPQSVKND